jgi:predicted metalloprotease with PDZ domain
MDDFCKIFHGGGNSGPLVKTYNLDEIIATLNQVAPYDWKTFLDDRIYKIAPAAPVAGIVASGWRLVYTGEESQMMQNREEIRKLVNAEDSVGLSLNADGTVMDAIFGMPAFNAGLGPGMKIIAVNGRRFSSPVFKDALKATKSGGAFELLVENVEYYRTFNLDYHDGEQYPHLVRDSAKPDTLSDIIRPHAKNATRSTTRK